MMKNNNYKLFKKINSFSGIIFFIFLIIISSFIFAFEHPNFIFKEGLGWLAWFSYIPVLFLVYKSNIKTVSLVGGIYGALSYALLGYWLFSFSSPGYFAIVAGYFFIYSILFLILKLVESLFKKNFWFVWWLIISSYEFLKTLGFAGFNYGVTGYSLWKETHIIQICDLIGVFGFTAFVIFPSFCIFAFIQKVLKKRDLIRSIETDDELFDSNTHIKSITETERKINFCSIVFPIIASIVWSIFFIFVLIYGFTSKKDTSSYPNVKILAVQTNDNPWKNGVNTYAENLVNVTKLTDSALEINTDVDIVVWPETAIVPSIVYQYESRIDERRYKIISYLLDYINEKSAVFVIGNGHTVVSKNDTKKNDYNSALVFIPGKNVIPPNPEIYSKMHLVPFSETFPYEKEFPAFYKYLIERGNHMWTPGSEYTVFKAGGLTFSTPICYEDTFEENSRLMYRNGARCFINLSNDAWCHNLACQNQHLSMAVFRSVENRVPSVRSTASGQTCIISLNGEILEEAEPFTSTYVIADVPVIPDDRAPTLYCRIGDGVGFFFVFLTLGFLLTKIIIVIIKKIRN